MGSSDSFHRLLKRLALVAVGIGSGATALPADANEAPETSDSPRDAEGSPPDDELAPITTRLKARTASEIPEALATSFGALLGHASGLERCALVGEWATSKLVKRRLAVAGALATRFEALGVMTALEHLARDPAAEVRAAAARAIRVRYHDAPDRLGPILGRLVFDHDLAVRRAALGAPG